MQVNIRVLALLAMAFTSYGLVRPVVDAARYWQLRTNAKVVRHLVEAYAKTQPDGGYPATARELEEFAGDTWPHNPFGRGKMALLATRDGWQAGGVVYCPVGQCPVKRCGESGFRWLGPADLPSPAKHETVSAYLLVFYANSGRSRLPGLVASNMSNIALDNKWLGSGTDSFSTLPQDVDWSHAAYALTSTKGDLFL